MKKQKSKRDLFNENIKRQLAALQYPHFRITRYKELDETYIDKNGKEKQKIIPINFCHVDNNEAKMLLEKQNQNFLAIRDHEKLYTLEMLFTEKTKSEKQVLSTLKSFNGKGENIYITPMETAYIHDFEERKERYYRSKSEKAEHPVIPIFNINDTKYNDYIEGVKKFEYILVDDVRHKEAFVKVFCPNLYMQTSEKSYQMVFTLTDMHDREVYISVQNCLQKVFGDEGLCAKRQAFRFVGFRNQKLKYRKEGKDPFEILLLSSTPKMCDAMHSFVNYYSFMFDKCASFGTKLKLRKDVVAFLKKSVEQNDFSLDKFRIFAEEYQPQVVQSQLNYMQSQTAPSKTQTNHFSPPPDSFQPVPGPGPELGFGIVTGLTPAQKWDFGKAVGIIRKYYGQSENSENTIKEEIRKNSRYIAEGMSGYDHSEDRYVERLYENGLRIFEESELPEILKKRERAAAANKEKMEKMEKLLGQSLL